MSKDPKLIKQSDQLWKEYSEETQETFWPKYNGLIKEAKALVKPFLQPTTQKPPIAPKPPTTPQPRQRSTSKRWPYKIKLVSAPIKTSVTARKRWLIAGGFMLLVGLLFGLEHLPGSITTGKVITKKPSNPESYGLYLGDTKIRLTKQNLSRFERDYLSKAKEGDKKAQFILGWFYYKPKLKIYNGFWSHHETVQNLRVDETKALHWFVQSAQQGNRKAKFMAGILYLKKKDVESQRQAFYWLNQVPSWLDGATNVRASSSNLIHLYLAKMYWQGIGTPVNRRAAMYHLLVYEGEGGHFLQNGSWCEAVVQVQDPVRYTYEAKLQELGKASSYDHYQGWEYGFWVIRRAAKGEKAAINCLKNLGVWGVNLQASEGNPTAKWLLGKMYEHGIYTSQNQKLAQELLQKNTYQGSQGVINALKNLAMSDKLEEKREAYDSKQHAIEFYQSNEYKQHQKLAENGDAKAQYKLAWMLYTNLKDKEKEAVEWMRKSAANGYAPAQYQMALIQSSETKMGKKLSKDLRDGNGNSTILWYELSAGQGYALAQNGFALMVKDTTQKIHWFTKSASQGLAVAQYNLGCLYILLRQLDKGFVWFQKLANQGLKPGLLYVSLAQVFGVSTAYNPTQGYQTLRKLETFGQGVIADLEKLKEPGHRLYKMPESTPSTEYDISEPATEPSVETN